MSPAIYQKAVKRCKDYNPITKVLAGEKSSRISCVMTHSGLARAHGGRRLAEKHGECCACLNGLTFLQSLDLLLCEAGPVPLQLPLELQPQLRLLALIPLHGDSSPSARSPSPCLSPHAALGVQQTALRHWQRGR